MPSELARPPLQRLLLATDLSARCDRALDRAAILASEYSAELTIVHSYEPDVYSLTRDFRSEPSWRKQPNLKQAIAIKRLRQDLGELAVPFQLVLEEGTPADVIQRTSENLAVDLIITGIARDETFGRLIFGGTVDRLVRRAGAPILVVKSRARQPYKNIVVATDFSSASRAALYATEKMFPSARITLVHCFDAQQSSMTGSSDGSDPARQLAQDEYQDFINGDPETAARLSGLPIFIERGDIGCVLTAYVADKSLDLVVFGSQGKNALTRISLGAPPRWPWPRRPRMCWS